METVLPYLLGGLLVAGSVYYFYYSMHYTIMVWTKKMGSVFATVALLQSYLISFGLLGVGLAILAG